MHDNLHHSDHLPRGRGIEEKAEWWIVAKLNIYKKPLKY
jgi:hypothetical protein